MKRILTSLQMRQCDAAEIAAGTPSYTLMERAATAVTNEAMQHDCARLLAVCGTGNNGGDGLIAARLLHDAGIHVDIYTLGSFEHSSPETRLAYEMAKTAGIDFIPTPEYNKYTLIIDAIFGIGLSRAPEGNYADAIRRINLSGAFVLSVDIPSGVDADTGDVLGEAVRADVTVAMAAYKRGHILGEGVGYCGKVLCADIGIGTEHFDAADDGFAPIVMDEKDLSRIPKRARDANKGTYGRVLVIAGSPGMCGAAYLCAKAAYRCGAGLVEIFTAMENRMPLQILLPEAIVTAYDGEVPDPLLLSAAIERAKAVVIGPGLGQTGAAKMLVRETFRSAKAPLICDADALNLCAADSLKYPKNVPVIVTPHPGEFSRLTGMTIEEIKKEPWRATAQYARAHGVICALKLARTVISDGETLLVNGSGSPALAKGGSGDVLCGVIAGMLCCGLSPMDAAAIGVYLHGLAGEDAAKKYGEYSPLASEVCDSLAAIIKGISHS